MAGLSSAASFIAPVAQGLGIVSNIVGAVSDYRDSGQEQTRALEDLKRKQQVEYKNAQQNAALERKKIAIAAGEDERRRKDALKRAAARQRAQFGASGIGTNSSSSAQALLLGLFDETESEKKEREALDTLRYRALDSELAQRSRLNVLEQTKLREQQKIGQVASANSLASSLLGGLSRGASLFS